MRFAAYSGRVRANSSPHDAGRLCQAVGFYRVDRVGISCFDLRAAFKRTSEGTLKMIDNGTHNVNFGADRFGFRDLAGIHWNLGAPQLYEHALQRNEAQIAAHGALVADTGMHTGRSPKDKFVVRDANTEALVWWDNNNAMTVEHFDALLADFIAHAKGKTLFAQDLHGGADPGLRLSARVFTEYAWHSLFIRNLLIRPPVEDLANFVPELTIVDLPSFRADPKRHGARSETIIACDFSRKIVLIGGTSYAGEMKKSVFTVLNYLLPAKQVENSGCGSFPRPRSVPATLAV